MWTKQEELYLEENFDKKNYKELIEVLGRSPGAIWTKARRLGLGPKILQDLDNNKYSDVDPNWLAGFTDGEGSFCINIVILKGRPKVRPAFRINLRADDIEALHTANALLGNQGIVKIRKIKGGSDQAYLHIEGFKKCHYIARPFFDEYKLHGKKAKSFETWKQILDLMKSDTGLCKNLTDEQVLEINKLRKGMNQRDNHQELIYDKQTKTFSRI